MTTSSAPWSRCCPATARCCGLPYRDIRHWAIHPGGRSILDKVQSRLELSDEQLVPARETLRNFGNMSSATVLFVLKHILDLPAAEDGPGQHGRRREETLAHAARARRSACDSRPVTQNR